jgi:N-acetylneuraminic acid mutarotase
MNRNIFLVFVLVFLTTSCIIIIQPVKASGDFWVTKAPMPNSGIFLGATAVQGEIYVIGTNYSIDSNFNYLYDATKDAWVSKAPMTVYRGDFAVATFQGKIYVMGGFIGINPQFIPTPTAANEMYDPATDTWTNKTSLPKAAGFLEAVTVNEKIYVMGGSAYNGTAYDINGTNEVYDPVSDSGQPLAPMPTPVFNFAMTAIGDKIYVMGGMGGRLNGLTIHSNQTQIYDIQTNTWTFGQAMPITTFSSVAVATTGVLAPVRIYYIGGTDETTWARTNTGPCPTQIYDTQTDSWSTGVSVPTSRESGFALAVVNDTVFAIGGYTGLSESPVNEQYIPLGYQGGIPSPIPSSNSLTPIPSLSPSPSIPEFPSWIAISLILIVSTFFVVIKKRVRRTPKCTNGYS